MTTDSASLLMRRLLFLVAAMSLPAPLWAQAALNQVRLNAAITTTDQTLITLSSADNVAVGDTLYVDREAMRATAVNTTTEVVTVQRGQSGTSAQPHLTGSIVWTGTAGQFFYSTPAGRCVRSQQAVLPRINILTGEVLSCGQVFGTGSTVASYWYGLTLDPVGASRIPYSPIAFRTGGSPPTTNTPAYTVQLTDLLIASMTYSGPFEIFLPAATGLLGKQFIIADHASLATGSPAGRSIIIRGVINDNPSVVLASPGAMTRLVGGITATSQYQWFVW